MWTSELSPEVFQDQKQLNTFHQFSIQNKISGSNFENQSIPAFKIRLSVNIFELVLSSSLKNPNPILAISEFLCNHDND
jgi:hypothetical protein